MILATPPQLPLLATTAGFRRFTVDEYHLLTEVGVLTEDDNLELIEGYLVQKMARNPSHDGTIDLLHAALSRVVPIGWMLRNQEAISLPDSEPEPDTSVVRGNARSYLRRHPIPADIGILVEVANSTLADDRIDKYRVYARAGIPCYWIINLIDRQVEVYTQPSGATTVPAYAHREDFLSGSSVPFSLDGNLIASIAVGDLLP